LRVWHEKYEKAGLTIVGVHTPEFFWEKPQAKVAGAVKDLGIRYPVVQDNDWAIWRRFGVWAWPTRILVDKQGIVRYRHIGEGAYGETEAVIQRLLAEAK
jgi:alkyl hydroperoxide reductase subunit AhpC